MPTTIRMGDTVSLVEVPRELFKVECVRGDGYIQIAPTDCAGADSPTVVGLGEIDEVFRAEDKEYPEAR